MAEHNADDCRCLSFEDNLRLAFASQEAPSCPVHPEPTEIDTRAPVALNDEDALKTIIGAALGAPLTHTQEIQ